MTENKNELLSDVIEYLLGIGSLDGCHYPDFPDNGEKYKRRYWWRKALREAWNTRATVTPPDKQCKCGGDVELKIESCAKLSCINSALSETQSDKAALGAVDRVEKTLNSFMQTPNKPSVFGLPPIDFKTIRAALQQQDDGELVNEKKAFWHGFEISRGFPKRHDILTFWNEYKELKHKAKVQG